MAKSDSFFIRAKVETDGVNFAQEAIDLGAYVDAFGKSVLRIHNIAVTYGSPMSALIGSVNSNSKASFQVTTQSQTSMVDITNKSVVSTGTLFQALGPGGEATVLTSTFDVAPQHFTNGYLVGVEQIYLGTDQTGSMIDEISIIMECTVETLSQSAAMALALSQQ